MMLQLIDYPRVVIVLLVLTIIIIFFISCSKPQIREKPQPVIVQSSREIPGYNKLHIIDSVTIDNPALLKTITTISLEYKLPESSEASGNEFFSTWNQEIQKALLRKGFNVLHNVDPVLLFDEDQTSKRHKTVCVIDSLSIRKESESIPLEDGNIQKTSSYNYHYHVADISAFITHNETIVWRGNVTVTSFDLLIYKKTISIPFIFYKITTDYVYSKKISDWIKQNAELLVNDNFSKYYSAQSDEVLHKKELILYAVKTLFETFMVEK